MRSRNARSDLSVSVLTAATGELYLTDGRSLFRLLAVCEGYAELENCRVPDENPIWMPVDALLKNLRRVSRA